jgi:hypothetical protein
MSAATIGGRSSPVHTFRRVSLGVAQVLVVAGPTALAFFAGGYFSEPRAWAGAGAWAAVVLGALAGAPLPRARAALVSILGLALLAAWTLASIAWAPIAGDAYGAGQIAVLYLGGMVAAAMVLRGRAVPWAEAGLMAGTVIVVGYGIAGRLVPGLLHYAPLAAAEGRLYQPLTYWNAMGEVAAIGFVLACRIAGDVTRARWIRTASAAAAVPLGVGLYIAVSRGALFACFAGLVALVAIAPRREQLLAICRAVLAGAIASAAVAPLHGFTSLSGSRSSLETDGLVAFGILIVVSVTAAAVQYRLADRERVGALALPSWSPIVVVALIAAGLTVAIVVGAHEKLGGGLNGSATRLTSLQSDRYDYWSVAFRAFAHEPFHGVGAGGWSVDWLRWRSVPDYAQDAHSLPLQTLAELGVVGVAFLALFAGGLLVAARRALRLRPEVAGAAAGLVVYFAHAPLDWDWQMPAVTLIAIALAGVVLGAADTDPPDRLAAAPGQG